MLKYTKEQQDVINSNSKRIVVLSCAGSGKSTTIVGRIERLIDSGVDAKSILALTFSNKATRDMKLKINKLANSKGKLVNIRTFHSFGLSLVKKYHKVLNYESKIQILCSADFKTIFKTICQISGINTCNEVDFSNYVCLKKTFQKVLKVENYEFLYNLYEKELHLENKIDLYDMIYLPTLLLEKYQDLKNNLNNEYKYIFVDEYQDTSDAQNRFLDLLINDDSSLCLVGDDDQAIYEWRNAKSEYIIQRAKDPNFELHVLSKNFRSQKYVINIANSIIKNNENRIKKEIIATKEAGFIPKYNQYINELDESFNVAKEISELIDSNRYHPYEIAVLAATNVQLSPIEKELKDRNIECKLKVVNTSQKYIKFIRIMKSILGYSNSFEFGEAINFPTNIFNKKIFNEAKRLYKEEYHDANDYDSLIWIEKIVTSSIEFENSDILRKRYMLISGLHEHKDWKPSKLIAIYLKYLEENNYKLNEYEKYRIVSQCFDMAVNYEQSYENKSAEDFLDHLIISSERQDEDLGIEKNKVNLLTMHGSKGLEFKVVFIIGLQAGLFPNGYFIKCKDDYEASRRLFYVAITRAKELLFLSSFDDPFNGDKSYPFVDHGFLFEIDKEDFSLDEFDIENYLTLPTKEKIEDKEKVKDEFIELTYKEIKQVESIDDSLAKDIELIESDDELLGVSYDLISTIEIPFDKKIIIVGSMNVSPKQLTKILKANKIKDKQVEIYDYNCKKVDSSGSALMPGRLEYNDKYIGIILGPIAHKQENSSERSLKSLFMKEEYPFLVNLVNDSISASKLKMAISKIKLHYKKTVS